MSPMKGTPLQRRPPGAPAPWSAGVLAGLRRTFGPSGSVLPTAPAPWSAGVLAGLRRTFGPSGSVLPTAPPHGAPASSPACGAPSAPRAVFCRPRRPMERRRPRRPAAHLRPLGQCSADRAAPWSAGVLAGLRRTSVPRAVFCRPRRPMERRRPRRPTPHLRPLGQCPADRAAPWSAGVLAGLRRTLGPLGGLGRQRHRADRPWTGRPTDHARLRRWPARTPALPVCWPARTPALPVCQSGRGSGSATSRGGGWGCRRGG